MELIPSIVTALRANANVTSLLPDGANGIITAGSLRLALPNTTGLPLIAVRDMGESGSLRALPFTQPLVFFRVYDQGAPSNHSYITINRVIDELIRALHRVPLTTQMSYQSLFELSFDNFITLDDFDEFLKLPFRGVRFRAFTVSHFYDAR